jgi:hypothetical protein
MVLMTHRQLPGTLGVFQPEESAKVDERDKMHCDVIMAGEIMASKRCKAISKVQVRRNAKESHSDSTSVAKFTTADLNEPSRTQSILGVLFG